MSDVVLRTPPHLLSSTTIGPILTIKTEVIPWNTSDSKVSGRSCGSMLVRSDGCHGKLLYQALPELIRGEGICGATVLRGVGRYGSSSRYHPDKILRLSQDLAIIIE